MAAIAAAVSNGVNLSDIAVICFGTGFMGNWIASDTSQWGAHQWLHGDGNPGNRTPALLINGKESPILNASMNGTSTKLVPQLCEMLLGKERYAYLNPTLDRIIPENDIDPADLQYMEQLVADADLSHALSVLRQYWPAAAAGAVA